MTLIWEHEFPREIAIWQNSCFFDQGTIMQTYYSSLQAIEQQTKQLALAQCAHCHQSQHLVSHGFIRKKQHGAAPIEVGKRVYCSNRYRHTGCGRTMQLYLDVTVRYLHYAGSALVAFILSLINGASIDRAYFEATGCASARKAYRWLNRFEAQVSYYRSLLHRPVLAHLSSPNWPNRTPRLQTIMSSITVLVQHLGEPLCAAFQQKLQRSLI